MNETYAKRTVGAIRVICHIELTCNPSPLVITSTNVERFIKINISKGT